MDYNDIYTAVKAIKNAVPGLHALHVEIYERDGSGRIRHDNWSTGKSETLLIFAADDNPFDRVCEWFFEDYEPFDEQDELLRHLVMDNQENGAYDEPSNYDDLNKYMGGYA